MKTQVVNIWLYSLPIQLVSSFWHPYVAPHVDLQLVPLRINSDATNSNIHEPRIQSYILHVHLSIYQWKNLNHLIIISIIIIIKIRIAIIKFRLHPQLCVDGCTMLTQSLILHCLVSSFTFCINNSMFISDVCSMFCEYPLMYIW